jgi:hypothetical protein
MDAHVLSEATGLGAWPDVHVVGTIFDRAWPNGNVMQKGGPEAALCFRAESPLSS